MRFSVLSLKEILLIKVNLLAETSLNSYIRPVGLLVVIFIFSFSIGFSSGA